MDPAKAHRTVCKNKGCVPGSGDGSQCSSWAGGKEKKGQHGQLGQRETGTGNGVGQAKEKKKVKRFVRIVVVVSGQREENLLKADRRTHKYERQFDELSLPCTRLLNEAYGRYLL